MSSHATLIDEIASLRAELNAAKANEARLAKAHANSAFCIAKHMAGHDAKCGCVYCMLFDEIQGEAALSDLLTVNGRPLMDYLHEQYPATVGHKPLNDLEARLRAAMGGKA